MLQNVPVFNLRLATPDDCELLFRLQKLDGGPLLEEHLKKFAQYQKKFEPEKIQVIEHNGVPIGRLRVVRDEEIYLGGIQILPQFRGKGIGTAVLQELIAEAETTQKPIRLEVFHTNTRAAELYSRLGFEEIGQTETQKIMLYQPK